MGHVGRRVRNGKVIYRVRYRGPDGRERSRNFKRKADAENYLTTVESAKLAGTWTDPTHGKMTFAAWLEAWWETAADLRPSTRARDRSYFNSMVLPRFGATPLAAIKQRDVQAWVANLRARGFAPATVVKAYQLLGRTMTAAVNADMIPRSPCQAIRLPKDRACGDALPEPGRGRPPGRRHRPSLPSPGAARRLWRPAHGGAGRPTPRPRRPA